MVKIKVILIIVFLMGYIEAITSQSKDVLYIESIISSDSFCIEIMSNYVELNSAIIRFSKKSIKKTKFDSLFSLYTKYNKQCDKCGFYTKINDSIDIVVEKGQDKVFRSFDMALNLISMNIDFQKNKKESYSNLAKYLFNSNFEKDYSQYMTRYKRKSYGYGTNPLTMYYTQNISQSYTYVIDHINEATIEEFDVHRYTRLVNRFLLTTKNHLIRDSLLSSIVNKYDFIAKKKEEIVYIRFLMDNGYEKSYIADLLYDYYFESGSIRLKSIVCQLLVLYIDELDFDNGSKMNIILRDIIKQHISLLKK